MDTFKLPDPIPAPELKEPQHIENLFDLFKTVSTAPTLEPNRLINQIQIYTNGTTYRLYWYDKTNRVWHYVTATA